MTEVEDKPNERVTMEWPKELKAQVRDKVGPRGLTEFTIEAVNIHLSGTNERIKEQELELNSTKHLVQLLADRLAMGGDPVDRLSSMMEIDLPAWIDTTGWPNEYAKLVKPEAFDADLDGPSGLSVDDDDQAAEAQMVPSPGATQIANHFGIEGTVMVPAGQPFDTRTAVVEPPKMSDCPSALGTVCKDPACPVHFPGQQVQTPVVTPDSEIDPTDVEEGRRQHEAAKQRIAERTAADAAIEPAPDLEVPADAATPDAPKEPWTPPASEGGDDLFARLMAKTGGKVDGFEDLKGHLKPASEIPQPEPVVQKDLCGKCGDEKVDGECWTCEM